MQKKYKKITLLYKLKNSFFFRVVSSRIFSLLT